MTLLDEAVASVREESGLLHLGPKDADVKERVSLAFAAVREALNNDIGELSRLNRIAAIAILTGVALILTAAVLVLRGSTPIGLASGAIAIPIEAYPILLFRRIDDLRKSISDQLPFYRKAYALMLILESAQDRPELWKDTVDKIAVGLT